MSTESHFPHLKVIKAHNGYVVFLANKSDSEQSIDATGMQGYMTNIMKTMNLHTSPEYIRQSAEASARAFEDVETRDATLENILGKSQPQGTTAPPFNIADFLKEQAQNQKPFIKTDVNCFVFTDDKSLFKFLKSLILSES